LKRRRVLLCLKERDDEREERTGTDLVGVHRLVEEKLHELERVAGGENLSRRGRPVEEISETSDTEQHILREVRGREDRGEEGLEKGRKEGREGGD
jgi:hypothetical protein